MRLKTAVKRIVEIPLTAAKFDYFFRVKNALTTPAMLETASSTRFTIAQVAEDIFAAVCTSSSTSALEK